jgi:hypothetical protein
MIPPDWLNQLSETEQQVLKGKRDRGADLESAIRIFLEFLRGFEFLGDIDRPCGTVFGSAQFARGHPVPSADERFRAALRREMAKAGPA